MGSNIFPQYSEPVASTWISTTPATRQEANTVESLAQRPEGPLSGSTERLVLVTPDTLAYALELAQGVFE